MSDWLQPDYALIAGLLMVVLSLPSLLSALADKRFPGTAALLALGGGALFWWAWDTTGGYAPEDIPMIVIELVARVVN